MMGVGVLRVGCLALVLLVLAGNPVECRRKRKPYRPVYVPYIFQLFGDKGWDNGNKKSFTAPKTTTRVNTVIESNSKTDTNSRTNVAVPSESRVPENLNPYVKIAKTGSEKDSNSRQVNTAASSASSNSRNVYNRTSYNPYTRSDDSGNIGEDDDDDDKKTNDELRINNNDRSANNDDADRRTNNDRKTNNDDADRRTNNDRRTNDDRRTNNYDADRRTSNDRRTNNDNADSDRRIYDAYSDRRTSYDRRRDYDPFRRTSTGPYYQASSHRTYIKRITGTGRDLILITFMGAECTNAF